MKRMLPLAICALALPAAASAATKTYEVPAFEEVSVSAGISLDITMGPTRSVVAETRGNDFDDIRIAVDGKVLRIDRPRRGWFSGRRTPYDVHVVMPTLRALEASSGAEARVRGSVEGDFAVKASSGADIEVEQIKGGAVRAHSSSGSDMEIAGSCTALEAEASSGSDLDAEDLRCEQAVVQASSGSDVSVTATRSVRANASSGGDIRVSGAPTDVKTDKSSGGDVVVGK